MSWFHRHTFNPDKWKEVSRVEEPCSDLNYTYLFDPTPAKLREMPRPPIVAQKIMYTNTCLTCGDLAMRVIAARIPDFYERTRSI